MGKTPIWFEMTRKTKVEKMGNKTVNVKTFGTERTWLSLLLDISSRGGKLKSIIAFKGKFNSAKQNRFNKNIHVANKDLFLVCQENS